MGEVHQTNVSREKANTKGGSEHGERSGDRPAIEKAYDTESRIPYTLNKDTSEPSPKHPTTQTKI